MHFCDSFYYMHLFLIITYIPRGKDTKSLLLAYKNRRCSICPSSIAKTGVSCTTYQTWTSLPKGSIVAFYNGIRLNSSSVLLEERYGRSDYRIRLNADRDLDIPKGYESSSKYCATLAHKAHRFRFEIFILWIDNFKLKKLKNLF